MKVETVDNVAGGESQKPDMVVLVHGFAASRWLMTLLQRRLHEAGFRTRNWGYPSLFPSVDAHAARFRDLLASDLNDEPIVHVIAHSMGAIVTRAALASGPLPNIGRLVFLSPPNDGSPIARIAQSSLGRILKPISDLSDRGDSFVNRLPRVVQTDVGIIAARFDNLVPLVNTHLQGESAHMVVSATHSSLLISRRAAAESIYFLKTGRFSKT